jgi:hypothetical protein
MWQTNANMYCSEEMNKRQMELGMVRQANNQGHVAELA